MGYFVYIIQSDVDRSYYKGFSENPLQRILAHNSGESSYTAVKIPWQLVYIEELDTKRNALIREKALKKYSHSQIESLIRSGRNIISRFSIGSAR